MTPRDICGSPEVEDELRDFDPCAEGGGQPCERCGYVQEPWRYSRFCQGCIWDGAGGPVGQRAPDHRGKLEELGNRLEAAMQRVDDAAAPLYKRMGLGRNGL